MKHIFLIWIYLQVYLGVSGQTSSAIKIDTISSSIQTISAATTSTQGESSIKKPELFNSGFIDFQNSAQMNASARVFRIFIGEPKKFTLPVSVYAGVSGNNLNTANSASARSNEQMILGIINPTSGVFNISTENSIRIGDKTKLTGVSIVYQLGEKLLSGYTNSTFRNFTFFSSYINSGFIFQTGAWEKDKENNMGIFWLLVRVHAVQINHSFEKLSGYSPDKQFFKGWSVGMGVEINNLLNIKSFYYRYLNPGAREFEIPIYQITFNYSLKPA